MSHTLQVPILNDQVLDIALKACTAISVQISLPYSLSRPPLETPIKSTRGSPWSSEAPVYSQRPRSVINLDGFLGTALSLAGHPVPSNPVVSNRKECHYLAMFGNMLKLCPLTPRCKCIAKFIMPAVQSCSPSTGHYHPRPPLI